MGNSLEDLLATCAAVNRIRREELRSVVPMTNWEVLRLVLSTSIPA